MFNFFLLHLISLQKKLSKTFSIYYFFVLTLLKVESELAFFCITNKSGVLIHAIFSFISLN